jgi:hypothetical protein
MAGFVETKALEGSSAGRLRYSMQEYDDRIRSKARTGRKD